MAALSSLSESTVAKAHSVQEAYSYNMNNKDKREIKKIIFEYFEFIEAEWERFQGEVQQ